MSNTMRESRYISASMSSAVSGSAKFNVGNHAAGAFQLPTGFKGLKMFYRAARDEGSTFYNIRTQAGGLVSTTIPTSDRSAWLPIPAEAINFSRGIQLVASSTQSAPKSIGISLKT